QPTPIPPLLPYTTLFRSDGRELGLGGLDETWPEPSGRAVRPEAASSVGPIAIHYWASLRPCLGTAIAPRRRARFRQTLLASGRRSEEHTSELQSLAYLVC